MIEEKAGSELIKKDWESSLMRHVLQLVVKIKNGCKLNVGININKTLEYNILSK